MKRKIIKKYDETNDSFIIHYVKDFGSSIRISTFRTPIRVNERGGYVGNKIKTGEDLFFGKGFIKDIYGAII